MEGFPGLHTPEDLLVKLKHDYSLLAEDRNDPYKAYNFFVTAEHIPDWISNKPLKRTNPYLRVCSHIATGAKHFINTDKNKNSVDSYSIDVYAKDGYVESGYYEIYLMVELSDKEEKELGIEAIEISDLAKNVLAYWENYFNNVT